ncbi:hypothetical protein HMPREF1544_01998 [Mucor circinelloides 1006PhL]|uniref:F-box domain-containing protein n=1 Tax=Mucor circinelloides f. circinelloides (strain 1006PhL) TaxID=1220926 RepID=S2K6R6_MUCC1|nr:hypothetical protein HMPREF1544_01998 [Mucor circinelloides 1006PhL]
MANLPPEILFKVFYDLDRSDKLQCATVCQAWCGTALHLLNSKIRLNTGIDLLHLFMKLCQLEGTIHGGSIRQLSIARSCGLNIIQINRAIFIRILSECTNLQILEFDEGYIAEIYCVYMIRHKSVLRLDSLQQIISPSPSKYNDKYLLVNWYHHRSINHLEFELVADSFDDMPIEMDLYSYIHYFPALKTLVLEFHTTVSLHSLLSACPQLESLQLYYSCAVNHLCLYEKQKASSQRGSNTHFQLKYLNIDAKYVNQSLFKYLHNRTDKLTHLTISKNFASVGTFIGASTVPLVDDKALSIKSIKFTNHEIKSNGFIRGLNDHFHALKRIEFESCNFQRVLIGGSNLTFDFNTLRLDYLSVDFTSVISQNTLINSTCLTVKRHEQDTLFYQRASKWSNQHLFTKNETHRYTNANAQAKRMTSRNIAVIIVEANTLSSIRMHCNGYRYFSQAITLD